MNIKIICIGTLKEKYWKEAVSEYSKRLSPYCSLKIIELKEVKLPANVSNADEKNVLIEEGSAIIKTINKTDFVIALDIIGKRFTSESLAKKISDLGVKGNSEISFVIGGSIGLSQEVLERANLRMSFSDMTFPHQMMRVLLLEQIYRAYKIQRNEPYHK